MQQCALHAPTKQHPLPWHGAAMHSILGLSVSVCKYVLTVPFVGGGVGVRAGLSLTRFPAPLSSSSQQVRRTCLQWKLRYWWASQRCPSRRSCSPREQQSQHSCRSHRISLHTCSHGSWSSSEKLLYLINILKSILCKRLHSVVAVCKLCV